MSESTNPEKKGRGRQAGQTKDVSIIRDPLFLPYEIHEDDKCFMVISPTITGTDCEGYFTTLRSAILHISRLKRTAKNKVYDFREYLKEYKDAMEEFKQIIQF